MTNIPVNLAVEDRLSEIVIRTILAHVRRGYVVGTAYGRTGYGYLRRTVRGWNRAAVGTPIVLLTDLDRNVCPQALIDEWLDAPRHHNLLFRIAVREIEAWLLADRSNLADFLAVPVGLLPLDPERLADPKSALTELGRRSRRRDIRERIAPRRGSTAKIGPEYNSCLAQFVSAMWDIDAAANGAQSLARTIERFRTFNPLWSKPALRG